ncbi:MAG TPA: DUF4386 domain-containing protein [Acidimicrobiia bacterium]|nr:DUF4386 domain-containing protein [Acidimicrobiia bacterium]
MATGTAAVEPTVHRLPVDRMRRASRTAGALYLLTFISIPTVVLYERVRETGYITGPGPDTAAFMGGILELIMGLACIGTAVALYPVVKRQSEAVAMGFVGTRVLEAATIFIGVASLWTIVAIRRNGAGAEDLMVGDMLAALYDRVFFVGQSLVPAVNALLLGTLMYRSRLVPRGLPLLGFLGAVTLVTFNFATLFGWSGDSVDLLALVAVLPIATWEFGLGLYLVMKGFRPEAVAALDTEPAFPGTPWAGQFAAR